MLAKVLLGLLALVLVLGPLQSVADERPAEGLSEGTGDVGTDAFVVPPTGFVVIFFFPGAVTNAQTAASVHCTNLLGATTQVLVEWYDFNGVRVGWGLTSIAQYNSKTYTGGATLTAFYFDDVGVTLTSALDQGVIRVLKKGTGRIICTAQILDAINNPPSFVITLPHFGPTGLH